MSKRSLMLSTATVALLTGAALADTTVDSSQTQAYTTGALLSGNTGQANAGNITIKSTGSVGIAAAQGAIVVDSDNWVLSQGTITNKDVQGAQGIHVDLSTSRNAGGAVPTSGGTVTGIGIYLDSGSTLSVGGNSTGKAGIVLDSTGCAATCTYNGAITLANNSTVAISGDSSHIMDIGAAAVLHGDLTFAGAATATAVSTTQTSSSMVGLYSLGEIDGNLIIKPNTTNSPTIATYGAGGQTIVIQGNGVTGYIQIGGTVLSSVTSKPLTSYTQTANTTTNPEAGPALNINSSVGGGIAILGPNSSSDSTAAGQVSMQGNQATINISSLSTATAPLTVGVYNFDTADPGFSFYNRGSITAAYTNYNSSNAAISMSGTSGSNTILTGGFFNSGGISSSVLSAGTGVSTTQLAATAIYIGNYVQLQPGSSKHPGDQAAFVNSGAVSASGGTIAAAVTGSRGGTATALYFGQGANVPSLINTGTIMATSSTTDATLSGSAGSANPVVATAILDGSGSLVSIYNAGTISAQAGFQGTSATGTSTGISPLDNNSQAATAINLSAGNTTTASGSGVRIDNIASGSRAAFINGNIIFGTGDNQVLNLLGTSGQLASVVNGNVVFGESKTRTTSGDQLIIGKYATLQGAVITGESTSGGGLAVDVQTGGTLTLLNNSNALKPMGFDCALLPRACTMNATTFNVATGGTVNLGVNQSLAATGVVQASQSITFAPNSTLGVAYASYLPQSANQFVLMTTPSGQLNIDQGTLDAFNNPASKPYLLNEAVLCVTTNNPSCARPPGLATNLDALVITVAPKTAAQIGLTANSLPVSTIKTSAGANTTFFAQVNTALGADNELGAAFINGVHNAKQAQEAYNNMAPNLTGGTRAIAISITDSATGPVGARQRALRMYGRTSGDMTMWGQEFVQMIKDPGTGAYDPNTGFKTNPGFKDHGLGFAIGMDGGSPKYGWYGGALTFYAGDVNELSRTSHQNQQWYLLTLYSAWRGKGLFLDTKVDAGYGHIDGKRTITLDVSPTANYVRTAQNKHAGALISGSVSTGAMMSYGAATFMPQVSLDGLYVREEGYTESNPGTTTVGDGFDLKVNQSYAKSLRLFAGLDVRYDLELWDFYLQPEARAGYRYDFVSDPLRLKMAFAYADTTGNVAAPGTEFTLTGPDPSQGNFVLGGTIAATTDTWTLGLNFDLAKGSNGAFQQIGTIHLLGRI